MERQGPHRAESHLIIPGHDGSEFLRAPSDKLLRGNESTFGAPFPDDAGTFRDSIFLQCPGPAVAPQQTAAPVQRAADAGDSAMAEFKQVFGADAGSVFVVGGDHGDFVPSSRIGCHIGYVTEDFLKTPQIDGGWDIQNNSFHTVGSQIVGGALDGLDGRFGDAGQQRVVPTLHGG